VYAGLYTGEMEIPKRGILPETDLLYHHDDKRYVKIVRVQPGAKSLNFIV
jgi:hypothetical protein